MKTKRLFTILIAVVMSLSLISCGSSKPDTDSSDNLPKLTDFTSAFELASEKYVEYYLGSNPNVTEDDAKEEFDEFFKVGSDGSYLSIEVECESSTNSTLNDIYELIFGKQVLRCFDVMKDINNLLGIPESFLKSIETSNAKDGKQTKDFDGISVTWSYYAGHYFDVLYEIK